MADLIDNMMDKAIRELKDNRSDLNEHRAQLHNLSDKNRNNVIGKSLEKQVEREEAAFSAQVEIVGKIFGRTPSGILGLMEK